MNEINFFECPSCGARITGDKKFCDYCGGKLKVPEEKKQSPEFPDIEVKEETISQVYNRPLQTQKTMSGLAVAAFILSLFGFSPISFFMGIAANSRISKPDSNLTGRGFAIAAIIISAIQIVYWIVAGAGLCSIANFY